LLFGCQQRAYGLRAKTLFAGVAWARKLAGGCDSNSLLQSFGGAAHVRIPDSGTRLQRARSFTTICKRCRPTQKGHHSTSLLAAPFLVVVYIISQCVAKIFLRFGGLRVFAVSGAKTVAVISCEPGSHAGCRLFPARKKISTHELCGDSGEIR